MCHDNTIGAGTQASSEVYTRPLRIHNVYTSRIDNVYTHAQNPSVEPPTDEPGLGTTGVIPDPPPFSPVPYPTYHNAVWGPAPNLPALESFISQDAPLVRQLTWLRSIAQEVLPDDHAIQGCGRRRINADMPKVITYNEQTNQAHYVNAQTCQNRIACPFCHSLTERGLLHKGTILQHAVDKSGLHTVMISLTLHHTREDSCASTYQAVAESLTGFKMGNPWKKFKARYGVVLDVVGTDYTWSYDYGHHPHKHLVLLLDQAIRGDMLAEMFEWVSSRWRSMVKKQGRWTSNNYGARISAHHGDFIEYITGLGDVRRRRRVSSEWGAADELTAGNLFKLAGGLTAWDLLRQYAVAADQETKRFYADVFRDYADGMAGANLLRVCNGFFSHDLVDLPEGWDTVINEVDDAGRIVVGALVHQVDVLVHRRRAIGLMLAEVAEQNGSEAALWSFLVDRVGANHEQIDLCVEETGRVIDAIEAEPERSVLDVIYGIKGEDTEDRQKAKSEPPGAPGGE